MKKWNLGLLLLLGGCSALGGFNRPATPVATFDLGAPSVATAAEAIRFKPQQVRVDAPSWLNSSNLYYRMDYIDPLRLYTYHHSRLVDTVPVLVEQRLSYKTAALRHAAVVPELLTLQVEEFAQHFEAANRSQAQVRVNARLVGLDSGRVIAEQSFSASAPAPSNDAPGAMRALGQATDTVLEEILRWQSSLAGRRR
jgi:cholesterol transport system auxiliary component